MAFFSFPLMFLQASISKLVFSTAAWLVLHLARRRWPGLDGRRTPWLLAQGAAAVTLFLVLLPASTTLSVFADVPVPVAAAPAAHGAVDVTADGSDDLADSDLPAVMAWLWLAIYGSGPAWHAWRWASAQRQLRVMLRAADCLTGPALQAHPAFARQSGTMPPVREIDAPVSPMLAGLLHPVLLLPCHVRSLPPAQQQLIVAHELAHLQRRDHAWQHAGMVLRMLLWFAPPVHGFYRRLQWAVEAGCDHAVLAGRPVSERRNYAAALVAQLGMQMRSGDSAALRFGMHDAQAMAGRIRLIRDGAGPVRFAGTMAVLLVPALCGASVLLQPHFVWDPVAPLPQAINLSAAAAWQAPLAQLHVNSPFGATHRPGRKPHGGVDLGARRGTSVMAPAAGRVVISTDHYAGGERFGKVVAIEHANGIRTLYAHLGSRLVQAGDSVQPGQQIALSGATGKVTGPHLHVEAAQNGASIDPQSLFGTALAQGQ